MSVPKMFNDFEDLRAGMARLEEHAKKLWLPETGRCYHQLTHLVATRCGRTPFGGHVADDATGAASRGYSPCRKCFP